MVRQILFTGSLFLVTVFITSSESLCSAEVAMLPYVTAMTQPGCVK